MKKSWIGSAAVTIYFVTHIWNVMCKLGCGLFWMKVSIGECFRYCIQLLLGADCLNGGRDDIRTW